MDIYKEEDFYKKEGYPTSDGGTGSLSCLTLTERTSLITAYSVSQFNADNYPALKNIQYKENRSGIFISTYYEDTLEMMEKGGCPFFNNEGEKPDLFEKSDEI